MPLEATQRTVLLQAELISERRIEKCLPRSGRAGRGAGRPPAA
jgi:hypothetical protein